VSPHRCSNTLQDSRDLVRRGRICQYRTVRRQGISMMLSSGRCRSRSCCHKHSHTSSPKPQPFRVRLHQHTRRDAKAHLPAHNNKCPRRTPCSDLYVPKVPTSRKMPVTTCYGLIRASSLALSSSLDGCPSPREGHPHYHRQDLHAGSSQRQP
jgi:hypothetical protein